MVALNGEVRGINLQQTVHLLVEEGMATHGLVPATGKGKMELAKGLLQLVLAIFNPMQQLWFPILHR